MEISNNTLKDTIDSSLISNDELSIVEIFYYVDDVSKQLIINLCIPYSCTDIEVSNKSLKIAKLGNTTYRLLASIIAKYYVPEHSEYDVISIEELINNTNKTVLLFDSILNHYAEYNEVFSNISPLDFTLTRTVGKISQENNYYKVTYPLKKTGLKTHESFRILSIIENTYFQEFINIAYDKYCELETNNITNNDDYYASLLTGLYCCDMGAGHYNVNNGFSLNIMMNCHAYTNNSITSSVKSILKKYKETILSNDLKLIENHIFIIKLYYSNTIDNEILELLEGKLDHTYGQLPYSLEESDEKDPNNDFSQPENIKSWSLKILNKVQRLDELTINTDHCFFKDKTHDYGRFLRLSKESGLKHTLFSIWKKSFNMEEYSFHSEERGFFHDSKLSDDIIDFLYSDEVIDYYVSCDNNIAPSLVKELNNYDINYSLINPSYKSPDIETSFITPFIISKANNHFKLDLDTNLLKEYYHYYINNHINAHNNDIIKGIEPIIFQLLLLHMDDKHKISAFLSTYHSIYDYYKTLTEQRYTLYDMNKALKIITTSSPRTIDLLKNNYITLEHLINIEQ